MDSYPKPYSTGGVLIRKIIALLKAKGFSIPLQGPILIAVSGGVDSMVLGHLLARYGRRVVDKKNLTFLHFDHGWRPESGTHEKERVKALAEHLGVGFLHRKLDPPSADQKKLNLEQDARFKRLQVYDDLAGLNRPYRYVLTAHHEGDLAESVFWRLLRGELDEAREGILFLDCQCLRPFLQVSKEEIIQYAKEEGVEWADDPTNSDPAQFRSWLRNEVFPLLETRYSTVRSTLARYALKSKAVSPESSEVIELSQLIGAMIQSPLNRSQRESLAKMVHSLKLGDALSLPRGAQLKRLKNGWMIESFDEGNQA